ncbi:hypothetical protein MBRA1_003125 [Malassezia brasiliensis]|uniref:WLM domain-containing protein n=1 Tax=Malassezia brasiliensis TaxID=1821822 RepID=A0AAF0IU14_9BASI|nr:hypothetical protein MBRA1_003125 [Malassezia brasiliensis]
MPRRGRGRFPGAARAHKHEDVRGAIHTYVALQHAHSERALALLRDVGAAVQGLMRRHHWHLPVLAEMYPRSAHLLGLNVNRGAKICLRLRDAARPDAFLERAEIVRTMLHELAHNVRGPHDTQFYTTLAQLTDEYDAAQRLGYWPGDGFLTPGTRLGGTPAPTTLAARRERAAAHALQRARTPGAVRLGGVAAPGRPLRELAAEAAVRRARDAQTCASATSSEATAIRAATEAAERDAIVVSDSDDEPDTPRDAPRARPAGTRHDPIVL